MKYITFALFLFCIHVSIALFNATGIYDYGVQEHSGFLNEIGKSGIGDVAYESKQVSQDKDWSFGDYIKGLALFIATFGLGVLVVPYTLTLLGLSTQFAIMFSLPVYFIYGLAIIQMISKDNYSGKT